MSVESGKTYVRRLRAVGATRDALALRLRLERALSHANLHPPWLPPSAILLVRRLRGERAAAQGGRYGRGVAPAEWERAIAARLDGLARRAARPARETVAAGAEAVIFDDRAELLACLAVDWCGGVETTRWWWQSLFGVREVAAALLPAWIASPEHVPAALARLSKAGKLRAFARALGDRDARDIRRAVTRKFSLRALEGALEGAAHDAGRTRPTREAEGVRAEGREGSRPSPRAPWEQFVPQLRVEELSDEQGCLVGTSLMLLSAPSVVRSSSFAEAVSRWRLGAHARAESDASPAPAEEARARAHDTAPRRRVGFDEEDGRGPSAETDARSRAADEDTRAQSATRGAPKGVASSTEFDADARRVAPEDRAHPAGPQTAGRDARVRAESSTLAREAERTPETRPAAPHAFAEGGARAPKVLIDPLEYEARIRTEFGGVFYLINLGLFLNLYGDFTTPLTPGIELPLWDFLALVGSELCGARVRRDPVWPLLAKLSGRDEAEEPGARFTPPDVWRAPAEWLAAFPGRRSWRWKAEGGRLLVLHPRGFLVLDAPSTGDAREQLEAETAGYPERLRGPLREAAFETPAGAACTLEGWLNRLMPYVRARLCRALGVRGASAAGRLVCEHGARVGVTSTRLDVTLALAGLPIEVRLSGLDRDPGWVPAAGRNVAFHYE